jgi:hypothetical protein
VILNPFRRNDIFLSHASEDKDELVDALYHRLIDANYKVWYDKNEILWGDELEKKITEGLRASNYGIVFISNNYFASHKEWTFKEFNRILTEKRILPIFYKTDLSKIKIDHPQEYEQLRNWRWIEISSKLEIDLIIKDALKKIGNRWSKKNINYSKLCNHLANKEWKQADEETYEVMIKAVGKKSGDWLTSDEILNFPCLDLRTIDKLWVKYSEGRFGFSVQKEIYLSDGGKPDGKADLKALNRFHRSVGWRDLLGGESVYPIILPVTPKGHLPKKIYTQSILKNWEIEEDRNLKKGKPFIASSLVSRISKCKKPWQCNSLTSA